MTRQNAKAEVEAYLVKEFYREFAHVAADVLEWTFREHRRRSPYFPAISEIHGLLCEYRIMERNRNDVAEAERQRQEIAQARKEGRLVEFSDIVKQLKEVAKFPEAPSAARVRRQAQMLPTLPFTKEQIIARRDAELEEIKHSLEAQV